MTCFIETQHKIIEVDCSQAENNDLWLPESKRVCFIYAAGHHENVVPLFVKNQPLRLNAIIPSAYFAWFKMAHKAAIGDKAIRVSSLEAESDTYWNDLFADRATVPIEHLPYSAIQLRDVVAEHPYTPRIREMAHDSAFILGRTLHKILPLTGAKEASAILRWIAEATVTLPGYEGLFWLTHTHKTMLPTETKATNTL